MTPFEPSFRWSRSMVHVVLILMLVIMIFPLPRSSTPEPVTRPGHHETSYKIEPAVIARSIVRRQLSTQEVTVANLIWQHFGARKFETAIRVANCESTLGVNSVSPRNRNGTHDYGVFQLNNGGTLQSLGGSTSHALNPKWNIAAAARLQVRSGWNRWYCYKNLRKAGIIGNDQAVRTYLKRNNIPAPEVFGPLPAKKSVDKI